MCSCRAPSLQEHVFIVLTMHYLSGTSAMLFDSFVIFFATMPNGSASGPTCVEL